MDSIRNNRIYKFFKNQAYDRTGRYAIRIQFLLIIRFFFLGSLLLFLFNFIPLVLMNNLVWSSDYYNVTFHEIMQSVIHVLWFGVEIVSMHYARKERKFAKEEKAYADSIDSELHLKRTTFLVSVGPPTISANSYYSTERNNSHFNSYCSSVYNESFDYEGFYVPPMPHHPYHLETISSSTSSSSSQQYLLSSAKQPHRTATIPTPITTTTSVPIINTTDVANTNVDNIGTGAS
ncbi:hypothetical protein PPL_07603 [Heterostelium album PN500]|uniref:Uncharacterized protein n=1 Tax=Heterostelium pallidum (strain ATCC 26659 / Pp 5 / PN500) TaxID=670386 RepID=D3BGF2_HETP5|nr:hypothetical protein PPL_07603 [Heterostelium album PN500]EFA79552.1 hypothetical protein PPL_07603 [Heterostelium album PN500]|eukprot:XP_020431673.1 hypothetical protein PPL_07603 [Heterostelium album PN500]